MSSFAGGRGEGGFPTNSPEVFIKSKKIYIFLYKNYLPSPPPQHSDVGYGEGRDLI